MKYFIRQFCKCLISVNVVTDKSSSHLSVLFITEKPAEFTLELKDQHCIETESVEFTIRLTKANIQLKWFKEQQEITADTDRMRPEYSGQEYKLVITETHLEDTAQYRCVLPHGVETAAKLHVEGYNLISPLSNQVISINVLLLALSIRIPLLLILVEHSSSNPEVMGLIPITTLN